MAKKKMTTTAVEVENNGHEVETAPRFDWSDDAAPPQGVRPAPKGTTVILNVEEFRPVTIECIIRGVSPYVQHAFAEKSRKIMRDKQAAGGAAKAKKVRDPKDFDAEYHGALHVCRDADGSEWYGIPANGLRTALISACRVAGVQMTKAKLAVFVMADGYSVSDATPLVRITKGEPIRHEGAVRLETGVADVRVRPMWMPGWEAKVRLQFDSSVIDLESVLRLLVRAGAQVGIGEGRHDSRKSAGMGWGSFSVHNHNNQD